MKKILSLTRKCVQEYDMIQEGDKIAVGVSGGKDSLLLLNALAQLQKFYPRHYDIEAITIDMGMPGMDLSPITEMCAKLGVNHTIVPTRLKEVIFDQRKESNPCSLCAKLRRGILHNSAVKLGCRKVALGHHFDDAVETYMLSLLFEGRISCFNPVTYLDRKDITLIRPMLYIHESYIRGTVRRLELPVVKNPCPANGNTKRQEVKELLKELNARYPGLRERIFGGIQRLPLDGWNIVNPSKFPDSQI